VTSKVGVSRPATQSRRGTGEGDGGFTLLEVLVALAIVGVAVTGVLQLTSQSLRLLRLTEEHVAAARLADRLAREPVATAEGVDSGSEGPFTWERTITRVETPKELDPSRGPIPQLFAMSVAVRWGGSRAIEVATMRASVPGPLSQVQTGQTGPPGSELFPQARPGQPGASRSSGSSRDAAPLGGTPGSSAGRGPFGGGKAR
jgi:general secretion pathway protein I